MQQKKQGPESSASDLKLDARAAIKHATRQAKASAPPPASTTGGGVMSAPVRAGRGQPCEKGTRGRGLVPTMLIGIIVTSHGGRFEGVGKRGTAAFDAPDRRLDRDGIRARL